MMFLLVAVDVAVEVRLEVADVDTDDVAVLVSEVVAEADTLVVTVEETDDVAVELDVLETVDVTVVVTDVVTEEVALDDIDVVTVDETVEVALTESVEVAVDDTVVVTLDVAVLEAVVCVHSTKVPARDFSMASFIRSTVPEQSWSVCPTIKNPSIVQFAWPCNGATDPRPVMPYPSA